MKTVIDVFLTGGASLVPRCSSLLEKKVPSQQSKKNLRPEYKEGYLIPQLASVACNEKRVR